MAEQFYVKLTTEEGLTNRDQTAASELLLNCDWDGANQASAEKMAADVATSLGIDISRN